MSMNTAKEGKSSKLIVKSENPASGQHDLARFMSIKFSVSCDNLGGFLFPYLAS